MSANTGGPASEKTLRDEFAGQALTGLLASPESRMPFDVVQRLAYDHAEAMLAEKARREATGKRDLQVEAVVQESSTTDAGKVVEPATGLQVVAYERAQALHRVAELEAANRELVEALDNLIAAQIDPMGIKAAKACKDACAILAKHKGEA